MEEASALSVVVRFCPPCAERSKVESDADELERALERALDHAGATPRLRRQSLETFPADGADALGTANEWLAAYRAGDVRNLWLTGPIGTGKTGIAWGLVRRLALDAVEEFYALPEDERPAETPARPALFVIWRDLLADYRASFGAEVEFPLIDRVRSVRVLALDDVGAERPTGFALEQLATLVEHRYQREAPTIVTSNYANDELAARLGHEDGVIGHRIVSRLTEGAVGLRFAGRSRRRAYGKQT